MYLMVKRCLAPDSIWSWCPDDLKLGAIFEGRCPIAEDVMAFADLGSCSGHCSEAGHLLRNIYHFSG